jgi:hypothetical protein
VSNRNNLRARQFFAIVLMVTLAAPGTALAAQSGGAHGGAGHARAGHFGGRTGAYGGRYYGARGGYGYYGGLGWGALGYGLFFATLPLYYSTFWWNSLPYYYSDANYYTWNSGAGEYETIRPPPEVESQNVTSEPSATDVFVYPKNGQNAEQQALDRFECHRWATEQSGFDPSQPGGVPATASTPAAGTMPAAAVEAPTNRQDYLRAQAACLEARGYSVK